MQITGTVTKVQKAFKSKAGKPFRNPRFSLNIDDSIWYNFGFDPISCEEGDVVEFDGTEGKWGWEGVAASLKVVGTGAAPAPSSSGGGRPDMRQASIVYQSSLKLAVEMLPILLEHKALKLPAKGGYEVAMGMLHKMAEEIASVAIAPDYTKFDCAEKEEDEEAGEWDE